jgi:hypothetical protein
MKAFPFIILLLAVFACEAADQVRDGSAPGRAIIMRGSTGTFEDAAFRIILQHYPDAKRSPIGRAVGFDGRTYIATITFSTAHHGKHAMYFDITHVN